MKDFPFIPNQPTFNDLMLYEMMKNYGQKHAIKKNINIGASCSMHENEQAALLQLNMVYQKYLLKRGLK